MATLNYNPNLPVYAQPETQAPSATVDPNKLQQQTANIVDQERGTVAGQMRGLLAENSPYLQVARTGALQTAAGRGLLNSSIAAGAGEEAAIKQALPIAQQDAQTYADIGKQNAKAYSDSILNTQVAQLQHSFH